jgi:hypothetical protein
MPGTAPTACGQGSAMGGACIDCTMTGCMTGSPPGENCVNQVCGCESDNDCPAPACGAKTKCNPGHNTCM